MSAFAYPYGHSNPRVRRLAATCYRMACSGRLGHARPEHDRFWLPRIDAYYLRNPAFVELLATPAGRCYFALRSVGRRARRLLPGTY
ncbi:MAG: hypothetical protein M3Q92_10775 [Actinomycetota bacterium]|nr:hypothetical protein [Actinomycetota bacterium]